MSNISEGSNDSQSSIKSEVKNELFRISCFLLYYIILIGLGAAILVGAFWASYHLIVDLLLKASDVRMILVITMIIIGISLLTLTLGIYLIKPLFSFSKNSKNTRVEVFESECPELFAMIKELANNTKCQMPKHVYLSPEVNACVFYDTSFWSIFFPIRKNLEIGLGLFDGTSIDEVKSIIAHEFGHFSQNSMKIGSTVYVTNTVLRNLILTDDSWDKWLDNWCMLDTGIIRYFGVCTRGITNLIKRQTVHVYRFVQKGYLKLSRYMEYDADSIACQHVGTHTFISALCKIEVLANKENLYHQMLQSLMNEHKMVSNYFTGKDILSKLIPNKEIPPLTFDCELSEPVRRHNIESLVKVEDIWASHPSLDDRIANASAIKRPSTPTTSTPVASWTLIPQEIAEKVSTLFTSIISSNVQESLSYISDEQFTEWVSNEIKENFMDERLRPFFGGTIFEFNLEPITDAPLESPFTEENALKITELIVRIEDWELLNQVKNKEIDVKEVQFAGKVYNRKNIPFEKINMELNETYEKVAEIYSNIYAYVCSKCDEDKQNAYRCAFTALFYAQYIKRELFFPLCTDKENLLKELNKVTRRDVYQYKKLCALVMNYEKHLKKVINQLDLDWIAAIINAEEYINNLKAYMTSKHNSLDEIDIDAINEMFKITDSFFNVQEVIYGIAKRSICNISASVLDL